MEYLRSPGRNFAGALTVLKINNYFYSISCAYGVTVSRSYRYIIFVIFFFFYRLGKSPVCNESPIFFRFSVFQFITIRVYCKSPRGGPTTVRKYIELSRVEKKKNKRISHNVSRPPLPQPLIRSRKRI